MQRAPADRAAQPAGEANWFPKMFAEFSFRVEVELRKFIVTARFYPHLRVQICNPLCEANRFPGKDLLDKDVWNFSEKYELDDRVRGLGHARARLPRYIAFLKGQIPLGSALCPVLA